MMKLASLDTIITIMIIQILLDYNTNNKDVTTYTINKGVTRIIRVLHWKL